MHWQKGSLRTDWPSDWLIDWLTVGSNKFYPMQLVELVAHLLTRSTSNVAADMVLRTKFISILCINFFIYFLTSHCSRAKCDLLFRKEVIVIFLDNLFQFCRIQNYECIRIGTERTAFPFLMYWYFTCESQPKVRYHTFWILSKFCLYNINRIWQKNIRK